MAQFPDPPRFEVVDDEYPVEGDSAAADHSRASGGRLAGLLGHRQVRWLAAALTVLVGAAVMATALRSEHAAHRGTATSAAPLARVPVLQAAGKPWPTSPAACGSVRYLPLIDADPLGPDATGQLPIGRVQVGGQTVHTVDLDARASTPASGLALSSLQFVTQLVPGREASYALVQSCDSTDTSMVLRVGTDGSSRTLLANRHVDSLLGDGRGGVWAAEVAAVPTDGPILLVRLPGPGAVRLPAGLSPIAISGNRLIGLTAGPDGRRSDSSGTLVSYDLASRRVTGTVGRASSLTVDRGVLLWLERPCTAGAECVLWRYDLASGATSAQSYPLPVQTSIVGGVLSPDGAELAFPLARLYEGPHIDDAGFGPPVDIAVLHLDTGRLEKVGGLTLPPTELPGLAFTGRDGWLVIAANEGRRTELLLWRQGAPRLLRPDVRISDLMLQSPPVLALTR